MRRTKLYSLRCEEVAVGNVVSIMQMNPIVPPIDISSDEAMVSTTANIIDVPVHHIRRIECGDKKDYYIAIHPELREILESPYIQINETAKWKLSQAEKKLSQIEQKLTSFKRLPWWKRIWIAYQNKEDQ